MRLEQELSEYFTARELIGSKDLKMAYHLRYQVYCRERGFLNPAHYPEQLESDEFDATALHFGIFHRANRQLVAVARLVSWSHAGFPFENHCQLFPGKGPDIRHGAEISRLVVAQGFRRRGNDDNYTNPGALDQSARKPERRLRNPVILLGLFRAIYRGSKTHGIKTWYAAMEPALQRHLRRLMVDFEQIGPLADYYGEVAPFRADIVELEKHIAANRPEMFAAFQ